MLYAFCWVIPQCLNFICRHFGTLCLFHLHRQVAVKKELGLRNAGVFMREKVWLENSLSPTFFHINTPTFPKLVILRTHPPMKMEKTGCSETAAYKIQTPGNYPEESIQQKKTVCHNLGANEALIPSQCCHLVALCCITSRCATVPSASARTAHGTWLQVCHLLTQKL